MCKNLTKGFYQKFVITLVQSFMITSQAHENRHKNSQVEHGKNGSLILLANSRYFFLSSFLCVCVG